MKPMMIGKHLVTFENKKINIHTDFSVESKILISFDEDECDSLQRVIVRLKSQFNNDIDRRISGVGC